MSAPTTPRHRVSIETARMRDHLASLDQVPVWSMDPLEAGATLADLTRLEAQVVALKTRVAAHADTVEAGTEHGASSTANWLAHTTRTTRPAAHRTVRLGHTLAAHDTVRHALATGDLMTEQAEAIIDAVEQLPDDLESDLVERAEAHLVAEAAHHDAKALRILGKRLLEVIAPDQADAHEARLLEAEEARAAEATRLTMVDDGHGQTHGRFTIPTLAGAQLKKMLLALAAPKHLTAAETASVERRPSPQRLGAAFVELIEAYPKDRLPQSGGTDATIVVTIDEHVLYGDLQRAGLLDTGEKISPSAARRLACTAGLHPAVLGGRSEVLDLGRTRRLHSKAQRIALAHHQHGCQAEGCDWPPGLCHAHHTTPWSHGGPTDLANARLLCPHHHARAHDPAYQTRTTSTGKITFHRRT